MTQKTLVTVLKRDPELGCRGCPFFHSNSEYPETWCTCPNSGSWGRGYYEGGPSPGWCPFRTCGTDSKRKT